MYIVYIAMGKENRREHEPFLKPNNILCTVFLKRID